jgi:H+-transporting ATPase
VSAFLLFWLGERVFHMDRAHVQTLMYLKLSVAGHLTIFLTRTRGPFWTIKPAKALWIAVLGTQIAATLIAVYGLFMTPLGWKYAGFVWAYAIVWALFTDRLKLIAYRILDPSALPLLAKKQLDLGPEVAREAFNLFQQRAHGESQQDQDWLEAERLVRAKHPELPNAS